MEIVLRYSKDSLAEVGRANRKWHYWPRLLAGSLRAVIYLGVGIVVGVQRVIKGLQASPVNREDVQTGGFILVGVAAIFALVRFVQRAKARKALAGMGEVTLRLDASGITTISPGGTSSFDPWSTFQDFRWGRTLALVNRARPALPLPIPFDTLPAEQAGGLRSALLGHLPERS